MNRLPVGIEGGFLDDFGEGRVGVDGARGGARSLIYRASVPYREDQYHNSFGFYATHYTIVTDAIAPKPRLVGL